jgi:hypothetical protein
MRQGIAPLTLLAQVESTAAWELADAQAGSYRDVLRAASALEDTYASEQLAYFRLLLAAHFVTVATFVPTDVDARIRHHVWWSLETEEQLLEGLAHVDEAAAWDPSRVSARTLASRDHGLVCGHQGEWFSVWAGALGRALALGADRARDHALSRIEDELAREARVFQWTLGQGNPLDVLRACTILAHNLGDLSRVVEAWPRQVPDPTGLRARFMRLGHEREDRYGGAFVLAGAINKPVMAPENDRFLAMRAARPLRKSRAFLLPTGPFFDEWGERIAQTPLLDEDERGEVVSALVETHLRVPTQQGCLRALAGFDRAFKGGLGAIEHTLPARAKKLVRGGPIREHVGLDRARFEARMAKRLEPFVALKAPRAQ